MMKQKNPLPIQSRKEMMKEYIDWYHNKEKEIDKILEMYKNGYNVNEIGTKLRLADSYITSVLKRGKEVELKEYMDILHITEDDLKR